MQDDNGNEPALGPVARLGRDLAAASVNLSSDEARFLVDAYYQMQDNRIRADGQLRSLGSKEPHLVLSWLSAQTSTLEEQIKRALDKYTSAHPTGAWMKSIHGIGPVISAGLLAHIDITKAPTVGHIWRFAGLDPTGKWLGNEGARKLLGIVVDEPDEGDAFTAAELQELKILLDDVSTQLTTRQIMRIAALSGRKYGNLVNAAKSNDGSITRASMLKALAKRPWNATLKVLCWKAGESFVKFHKNEQCFYGHKWRERKDLEIQRNEAGAFAEQAANILATKNIGKETDAYKAYSVGKLPPAHIHARARRYAVKLFLSHLHHMMYRTQLHQEPPYPYPIAILGHAHMIQPPEATKS